MADDATLTVAWGRCRRWREGRRSRCSSRCGLRRVCCILFLTAAAGGTCIAGEASLARRSRLLEREAEFARPQWVFDPAAYGFLGRWAHSLAATLSGVVGTYRNESIRRREQLRPLGPALFRKWGVANCGRRANRVVFIGRRLRTSPMTPAVAGGGQPVSRGDTAARRTNWRWTRPTYPRPRRPSSSRRRGDRTAHAFYYAPSNPDFSGLRMGIDRRCWSRATEDRPQRRPSRWTWAFNTGPAGAFGIVDVNYGGSTGYGTEYRRRLNGNVGYCRTWMTASMQRSTWRGAGDVPTRSGWPSTAASAGGYTTLAALTFHDVFKAGDELCTGLVTWRR